MSTEEGTPRKTAQGLADKAAAAELEAVHALNALASVTDPRIAASVKEKVLAAFRANADFFLAVAADSESAARVME